MINPYLLAWWLNEIVEPVFIITTAGGFLIKMCSEFRNRRLRTKQDKDNPQLTTTNDKEN